MGSEDAQLGLTHLLRVARDRHGWNQYQAADYFGINQSSYQRWESKRPENRNQPRKSQVPLVARFLSYPEGVRVSEADVFMAMAVDLAGTEPREARVLEVQAENAELRQRQQEEREATEELRQDVTRLYEAMRRLQARLGPPEFTSEAPEA